MKRTVTVKDEAACPAEPDAKRAKTEEDAEADSILELDVNEFECVVCYDLLVDPVVGKCGHDFCKACLEDWRHKQHTGLTAGLGKNTTCPVCRKDVGLNNSTHREPDELGVCIRLKELIERLFPKRSKERRKEVEAEEEERKRRRRQERQEQHRQAAQRTMHQMLDMQYPAAPAFAGAGGAGPAAMMWQLQHRLRLQNDMLQGRSLWRGNPGGGGGHDSNAERGAAGAGSAEQQLRRSERLRGAIAAAAATGAAAGRAADVERLRRVRQAAALLDTADMPVGAGRIRLRGRGAELWNAQAGAHTAGAQFPAGEGAATDGAVAAPAAPTAASQQGPGGAAGQHAGAAGPDLDLPLEPVGDLSPDMFSLDGEHGPFPLAPSAGDDAHRAGATAAAAATRTARLGMGAAVAAEAAAAARQRLRVAQLQQVQQLQRSAQQQPQQQQGIQRMQEGQHVLDGARRVQLPGARTGAAEQGRGADVDPRLQRIREVRDRLHMRMQLWDAGETAQQTLELATKARRQQQQQQQQPAEVDSEQHRPADPVTVDPGRDDGLLDLFSAARAVAEQAAEVHAPDMPGILLDLPSDAALRRSESDDTSPLVDELLDALLAVDGHVQQEQGVQNPADISSAPAAAAEAEAFQAAASLRYRGGRGAITAAGSTGTADARDQAQSARRLVMIDNPVPDWWRGPARGIGNAVLDEAEAEVTADVLLRRSRAIATAGEQTAAQQRRRFAARRRYATAAGDAAAATLEASRAELLSRLVVDDPLADTAGSSGAAGDAAAATAGRMRGTAGAAAAAADAAGNRSTAAAAASAAPPAEPAAAAGDAGTERQQVSTEATAPASRGRQLGSGFLEVYNYRQQAHRNQAAAGRRHSGAREGLDGTLPARSRPLSSLVALHTSPATTHADDVQAPLEDPVASSAEVDATKSLDAGGEAARFTANRELERALRARVAAAAPAGGPSNAGSAGLPRNSAAAAAAAPPPTATFRQTPPPPAAAAAPPPPLVTSIQAPAAAAAATATAAAEGSGRVMAAGRVKQAALQSAASGDLAREVARETSTAVARAVARQIRREVLPQLRSGPPPTVVDGGYISSDMDEA